jgi:hypothetical protein
VRGSDDDLMEQAAHKSVNGMYLGFLERLCFRGNGDEILNEEKVRLRLVLMI